MSEPVLPNSSQPDPFVSDEVIGYVNPASSAPAVKAAEPVREAVIPEISVAQAERLDALAQRFRDTGVILYYLSAGGDLLWHDEQARPDIRKEGVCPLLTAGGEARVGAASYIARWSCDFAGGRLFAAAAVSVDPATPVKDAFRTLGAAQLETLANLIGQLLAETEQASVLRSEVENLSGQLAHTYEELSLIYQLSSGMRVNRDTSDFFLSACTELAEVLNVQAVGYALTSAAGSLQAVMAGPVQLPTGRLNRLAEELTELLVDRGQPLIINDLRQDPALGWAADHVRELLAVPIQRQENLLGVMFAVNRPVGQFTWGEAKLMSSIASQASAYLENSLLYQDLQSLLMGLLHALTSAVDAKDTYTCGHSQRVALISHALALKAGVGPALAQRVYISGLLHDVGKIGVSEAVLRKPGRLEEAEQAEMRRHPIIGAKILRQISQVQDIIPGVLHHHERFDGNGYPHRLAGHDIPLFGRIICVADCLDAMTSDRVYRPGMPVEVALAEIVKNAGTQFDPEIAAAAQSMGVKGLSEILATHRDTPDQYHNAGLMAPGAALLAPPRLEGTTGEGSVGRAA
jgi:HD-GYP domain-containing protein (c-di-GMP phosphodiesterase class II)